MPLSAKRIAGAAARTAGLLLVGLLLAGLLLGRGATAQAATNEPPAVDEPIVAFVPEVAVAVLVAEAPGAALTALLEAIGPVPEGLPAPLAARVGAVVAEAVVAEAGVAEAGVAEAGVAEAGRRRGWASPSAAPTGYALLRDERACSAARSNRSGCPRPRRVGRASASR
jgi:hypothetical protein